MQPARRIGVLTCGGDVPGMNPALKAIAYRAAEADLSAFGLYDGWETLLTPAPLPPLELVPALVRTWDQDPGSHLGCARTNPLRAPRNGQLFDASREVLDNVTRLKLDALIVLGNGDTLGTALQLSKLGLPVVFVPATVTADLPFTDYTLGFDSSLHVCADMIARSRTPSGAHRWVQVVEVAGRHSGHLALWSGVAGGAQTILIPEHRFELDRVYALLEERLSRPHDPRAGVARTPRYATVVVSVGAVPVGGHEITIDASPDEFGHTRLGGIGALLAARIRADADMDARELALGHPQRGGVPSPVDRILAFRLGSAAVEACAAGHFGVMVAARGAVTGHRVELVPLEQCTGRTRVDVEREYDTSRYFARRTVAG